MGLVTACLTIIGATTSNAPMNISRTLGVAIRDRDLDIAMDLSLGWMVRCYFRYVVFEREAQESHISHVFTRFQLYHEEYLLYHSLISEENHARYAVSLKITDENLTRASRSNTGTVMWLQTIETFLWRYGTELVLYSVYSLLRFVTFGAIDAFIRGFWNIDKLFYPTW